MLALGMSIGTLSDLSESAGPGVLIKLLGNKAVFTREKLFSFLWGP